MNATFVPASTPRTRKVSKQQAKPLTRGQWRVSSDGTTKEYGKKPVSTYGTGRTGVALALEQVAHAKLMRTTGLANPRRTAFMLARVAETVACGCGRRAVTTQDGKLVCHDCKAVS